jgi:hypothetical protein
MLENPLSVQSGDRLIRNFSDCQDPNLVGLNSFKGCYLTGLEKGEGAIIVRTYDASKIEQITSTYSLPISALLSRCFTKGER